MTDTQVKYFTLDEANRTLPYVSRIVQDIVDEYGRWRDCIYRYELLAAGSRADEGETEAQAALRERVDAIARRINGLIDELSAVGCVFKGFEGGLVDFYARLEGRDVCLCWRLGEPAVGFWHELDAGFAGRQALLPQMLDEETD